MVNGFHTLPPESDFGWTHDYSSWAPNSRVTVCKVPWNASYRDIVRFSNRTALNAYIDAAGGEGVTLDDASYLPMGQPIDLDIPFGIANEFNYLRVYNNAQPVTSPAGADKAGYFYYFITSVERISGNTTRFTLQLDVWQTFGYELEFGMCFIERGHIGIAASNAFSEHGSEFLTIPEGLDIGGEYMVLDQYKHEIGTARGSMSYGVIIMSTVALDADPGTVEDPKLVSANGSLMENLPNGAELYYVTGAQVTALFTALADKPWVTQGIISITAIPGSSISRYEMPTNDVVVEGITIKRVASGSLQTITNNLKSNWRDTIMDVLPLEKYKNLKKLQTYPYMVLEMTGYNGTPLIIKPESWDNDHIQVGEVPHLVPGGARVSFFPVGYNRAPNNISESDSYGLKNDNGEFLDMSTCITNFPTFSTVNNSFTSFLASNKNSIAFSHSAADWSQQRALTGNQLSFDQASAGMDLTNELNRLNVNAATQSTNLANQTAGFQALQSGASGIVTGAAAGPMGLAGGAMGALNAGLGYAITANANNQSLNISTNLQNASTNASISNAGYMRDSNKSYADFAAKGDYQNAIAGINAKVQDAKLTQPTTSGQIGGDAFNLARYKWGVDVKVKVMQLAALRAVGNYWLRYGYQMNLWQKPPVDLHCMSKFTYWKLRESYVISAKCPEVFKETIRGIFEKGVTVWKNPADMGVIDLGDNEPIGGITIG